MRSWRERWQPRVSAGRRRPALDTAKFYTRPWKATRTVADGDTIDLGGRVLRVVAVPGHTPDAVALLDSARGLLWTGDTYYDAPVWLYVPETDLDAYERSIDTTDAACPVAHASASGAQHRDS
jgi:glyoxylase-like metal-dependent hydrolase (beta-lactamase superfamily II)